jgi:hypothetical protein
MAKKGGPTGLDKPPNLKAGFKDTGILSAGMNTDVLVKFERAVHKMDDSLKAANTRLMGNIATRAKNNLRASILRPGERGQGEDDRNRQTGKFTFGVRGGGAFVGRTFAENNAVGFGYPDVAVADRKTKGIWRVLEFGLGSRLGSPQAGVSVPAIASSLIGRYGSKGAAMLPQRFGFTSPNPAIAQLVVLKGPAVASGATYYQLFKTKQRRKNASKKKRVDPKGQFGKFFLTRAIDEVVVEARKEYERIPTEAYR